MSHAFSRVCPRGNCAHNADPGPDRGWDQLAKQALTAKKLSAMQYLSDTNRACAKATQVNVNVNMNMNMNPKVNVKMNTNKIMKVNENGNCRLPYSSICVVPQSFYSHLSFSLPPLGAWVGREVERGPSRITFRFTTAAYCSIRYLHTTNAHS